MALELRRLEQNSGRVGPGSPWRLELNPTNLGYSNAQIDDYVYRKRRKYNWYAGTRLKLSARFSHPCGDLIGTAGFGFWNAPFGDMTMTWPALPKATWFFYASRPTNLPLPLDGPGRGWFASTLDASSLTAVGLAPLTPAILLLNNVRLIRKKLWPMIRRKLKISYAQIVVDMEEWHTYELTWLPTGCQFLIDGKTIMKTHFSPNGPLGFVAWIDNQYMIATPNGRFGWGTCPLAKNQRLMIADLEVTSFDSQ
jgi:hypothetical protein